MKGKTGEIPQKLEKEFSSEEFLSFMYEKCGLDRTAAENLRTFIEDQLAATGCLPGDGRIICEHFSDETGDRRIVIHTPFEAGSTPAGRSSTFQASRL